MKYFVSSTLLVATSSLGAAAAADPSPSLAPLFASLHLRAGDFDFAGALACTADLSTGDVTDEAGCATATDKDGAPCVWCDASAVLGQGACVSSGVKSMAGQFWDQLCKDAGSGPEPAPKPAPEPAPKPAPKPAPEPAPVPDDNGSDDGGVPDEFKCSIDASFNLIADEAACVARKDPTSASGEHCVWCNVPLVGGSCVTSGEKSSMSILCKQGRGEKHLRGAAVE